MEPGELNPRAFAESPGKYADLEERAARAALGAKRGEGRGRTGNAPANVDLARLVASWANLPPDVRAGIVAGTDRVCLYRPTLLRAG